MANPEHLEILEQGVTEWNVWRKKNPDLEPDLRRVELYDVDLVGANLRGADLREASLSGALFGGVQPLMTEFDLADLRGELLCGADLADADLTGVKLSGGDLRGADLADADLTNADLTDADLGWAVLSHADLSGANLSGATLVKASLHDACLLCTRLIDADLSGADLSSALLIRTDLSGAHLEEADLRRAHLNEADLSRADLTRADMRGASLIDVDLSGATLSGCRVHGISAWDLKTDGKTKQESLVITPKEEQEITVDNLEVAQFLYLVLNNEKLGHFIRAMRTSAVLILGSLGSPDATCFLEGLRRDLSALGYVPIIFNFNTSETNYPIETVRTIALLSNFVVVDLSEPAGQLAEMAAIAPDTYVPFLQIAREGSHVTWMLKGPQDWISKIIRYSEPDLKALPAFIENRLLPCATRMNGLLKEKRKEIWE